MALLLFVLGVAVTPAFSQLMEAPSTAEIPQQSAYVEFGGNALAYSLNYDALFKNGWGIRLGGGFYPHDFLTDEFRDPAEDSYAFLGLVMGLYAFGTISEQARAWRRPAFWHYLRPNSLGAARATRGYLFDRLPLLPHRIEAFQF
ncbi:MAG: hypothetical protein U5J63_01205 [Fodinibius sp.]|nr:hypothetical protein [Fodinibius sp.]